MIQSKISLDHFAIPEENPKPRKVLQKQAKMIDLRCFEVEMGGSCIFEGVKSFSCALLKLKISRESRASLGSQGKV